MAISTLCFCVVKSYLIFCNKHYLQQSATCKVKDTFLPFILGTSLNHNQPWNAVQINQEKDEVQSCTVFYVWNNAQYVTKYIVCTMYYEMSSNFCFVFLFRFCFILLVYSCGVLLFVMVFAKIITLQYNLFITSFVCAKYKYCLES